VGSREPFRFDTRGTAFWVYAQPRRLGFAPERVRVDASRGPIGPGPADATIEVIDALDKPSYFSDSTGKARKRPRPPYPADGPRTSRPATPRHGAFTHLKPGQRAFSAAMVYAAIRTTLAVWHYLLQRDQPLAWHFGDGAGPVLQVHPRVQSHNAWSGNGFLEFGFPDWDDNTRNPFCENLEVIAHETGHLLLKAVIGTMPDDEKSLQHRAHEEAGADLVALITILHFDSVVDRALGQTGGFLYSLNLLSRIGEWGWADHHVARTAFNDATMEKLRRQASLNKHQLSSPFTGAVYDVLVRCFVRHLRQRRAIDADLADRCRHLPGRPVEDLRGRFTTAWRRHRAAFRQALTLARDDVGWLLAGAWRRTSLDGVTYGKVLTHLLEADAELGTDLGETLRETFRARGITPERAHPPRLG
jgi:hypothetical protein